MFSIFIAPYFLEKKLLKLILVRNFLFFPILAEVFGTYPNLAHCPIWILLVCDIRDVSFLLILGCILSALSYYFIFIFIILKKDRV